eukprot:m.48754 g.48754  ORF g.48754 m.48754 type:complete len:328 (-) comp13317_c0_seq1:152-1135(-)
MATEPAAAWLVAKWTCFDCIRIALLSCLVAWATQRLYTTCYHAFQSGLSSDCWFFIAATMLVHETLYYGFNGLLWWLSRTTMAEAYQLPRQKHQRPTAKLVKKTLMQSAISHWLIQPLMLYLLYPILAKRMSTTPLPLSTGPLLIAACQFASSVLINDALFYWSHRLLHHKVLYKRFHKQHHEYTGPIGIAAEYAGPLEQLLSNQFPTLIGPFVTGMHVHVWLVYLTWRLVRTYETHSGLSFRNTFLGRMGLLHGHGALYHDFHHTNNKGNYGGNRLACDTQYSRQHLHLWCFLHVRASQCLLGCLMQHGGSKLCQPPTQAWNSTVL